MEQNSTKQNVVKWNREKLERFKQAYAACPGDGNQIFQFEGHDFVKAYAKYLIEFLDQKLPDDGGEDQLEMERRTRRMRFQGE